MAIQVISDLYLQYYMRLPTFLKTEFVKAKYLFCAGGIGNPLGSTRFSDDNLWCDFVDWASSNYTTVFYVMGNDESHHNDHEKTVRFVRDYLSMKGNCVFLEKGVIYNFVLDDRDFKVVGCTLWSNTDKIGYELSGDVCIKTKTWDDLRQVHESDVKWLETVLLDTENTTPVIVMTHHLPSFRVIPKRFIGNPAVTSVASHLDHLLSHSCIWIFGHSHECVDDVLSGTRYISNPVGYKHETTGFSKDAIII
jgi:hypothetical protein